MSIFNELRELVLINSYTFNKQGVDKNAELYKKKMKSLGFECEEFFRKEIGNHLLFKSKKRDGKKLLLVGHIDTVFPKGTFEEFKEDEEWVYGPGVCDMKGGNLVAIEALREVYKKNSKITNIDFLLVSDEESGSEDSIKITSKIAKEYDYALVYEAAGKNLEVVTARKGVGTFKIEIEGKASHAGNHYSDGIDANLEASYKLQELVGLTNLEEGITVNVGKIEGGIGANTISPKANIVFEIRYTKNSQRDYLLEKIDKITSKSYVKGTVSKLSGKIQRDVMEENQTQLEFVKLIKMITKDEIPYEKRGGVSDANIIASVGVPVLDGFGPYGDGDHTVKERALKQSFFKRVELSVKIFEYFQYSY